jgi:hypothetical protein
MVTHPPWLADWPMAGGAGGWPRPVDAGSRLTEAVAQLLRAGYEAVDSANVRQGDLGAAEL